MGTVFRYYSSGKRCQDERILANILAGFAAFLVGKRREIFAKSWLFCAKYTAICRGNAEQKYRAGRGFDYKNKAVLPATITVKTRRKQPSLQCVLTACRGVKVYVSKGAPCIRGYNAFFTIGAHPLACSQTLLD